MAELKHSKKFKKALSLGSVEKKALVPESMAKPNESKVPVVVGRGADSPKQIPNDQD